jgi:hypothetical protein
VYAEYQYATVGIGERRQLVRQFILFRSANLAPGKTHFFQLQKAVFAQADFFDCSLREARISNFLNRGAVWPRFANPGAAVMSGDSYTVDQ